jgi:hypothetical protein
MYEKKQQGTLGQIIKQTQRLQKNPSFGKKYRNTEEIGYDM